LGALVDRRAFGIELAAAPILAGWSGEAGPGRIPKDGGLTRVGSRLVRASLLDSTTDSALRLVHEFHRRQPAERGMPLETLRRSLRVPEWLAETAIERGVAAKRLVLGGGTVRLAGFEPRVEGGEPEVLRLVKILQGAGLTPPSVAELERETGRRDVMATLRLAAGRGLVEAVERDRYYAIEALQRFTEAVRDIGRAGEIQPAAVRERLGISRKYLIPLLEWADARGITVRAGETRRLGRAGH
jgi:selenocysteine-specific elongation factor